MLGYWWAIVSDAGPPITQHWVNVSILYMGRSLLPRALKYENNDIHAAEKPKSSKHAAFTKCCVNVGPPSATLAQHLFIIGFRVSWPAPAVDRTHTLQQKQYVEPTLI